MALIELRDVRKVYAGERVARPDSSPYSTRASKSTGEHASAHAARGTTRRDRATSRCAPVNGTDPTDEQLVARVQQGDKRAFEMLVRKYQHRIYSLVSRFVRDADEVQDVVQEAFIKLPSARRVSRRERFLYLALSHRDQYRQEPPAVTRRCG